MIAIIADPRNVSIFWIDSSIHHNMCLFGVRSFQITHLAKYPLKYRCLTKKKCHHLRPTYLTNGWPNQPGHFVFISRGISSFSWPSQIFTEKIVSTMLNVHQSKLDHHPPLMHAKLCWFSTPKSRPSPQPLILPAQTFCVQAARNLDSKVWERRTLRE